MEEVRPETLRHRTSVYHCCGVQRQVGRQTPVPPFFSRRMFSRDIPQFYSIWGDENGDGGSKPMVGEASISMATACFGTSMNGNNGHDETDVLYIAFPGSEALPGANGANWAATSWSAFENSIETLGNKLIQSIGGGSSSCSWPGHCEGASCSTNDDCSDPWAWQVCRRPRGHDLFLGRPLRWCHLQDQRRLCGSVGLYVGHLHHRPGGLGHRL